MASTLSELSPVLVELEIEVAAEDVTQAIERAYRKLAREARVRGFRRGKAPRSVLRRMYGEALLNEVRGELISRAFVEALEEHEIDPISEPEIDAGELEEGQGYSFKIKLETTPRLQQIELEGIELERYRIEVPPELIDAELQRLRAGMATSRELEEPRPARAGDLLTIGAKRWEEGEWTTSRMPPEQEIVLEQGTLPDELFAALEGAAVDEEKVVDLEQPAPDGERNRLLVRVLGIRSRQVPELDDEFAKDVGDFENLEALREDVEQRLREMLENNEDERLRHTLFTALREKNPLELPATLVERQTAAMKAQFAGVLGAAGAAGEGEDDEAREGARERLEEGASSAAKGVIHHHLLLKEVARLWEVAVADDEVDEEIQVVARQSGLPLPMVRAEYAKGPRLEELRSKILERKVFDLAKTKVKIVEIDPPSREADADQG